ncbi:hypothetical protein DOY81_002470, partial [Sarcophaga bullata]
MAPGCVIIRTKPTDADELSKRETKRNKKDELKYCYGFGFKKIRDPLIFFNHNTKQWTYPQDIELQVDCCAIAGQCYSSAEIKADQKSSLKEAEIIKGGIDQQYIRILIKAQNTYWLRYEVRLYG